MSVSSPENNKDVSPQLDQYYDQFFRISGTSTGSTSGVSEIEEEGPNGDVPAEIKELFEMKKFAPMPSIKEEYDKGSLYSSTEDHSVYVAVGKSPSSLDALDWALRHAVNPPSTTVYLIHIYPEIRQIPTPCKFRIFNLMLFLKYRYITANLFIKFWLLMRFENFITL